MGFQTTGTASEFFAVDAKKVTPIPKSMSFEEGAMLEPLAVAVHAVRQMGDVTGMNIAVLGAGPIGNLVAQAAKGLGAAKVMITDVSDYRLEKAKECGVDVCVNTKEKNSARRSLKRLARTRRTSFMTARQQRRWGRPFSMRARVA